MKSGTGITLGGLLMAGVVSLLLPQEGNAQRQRDFLFGEPNVSLSLNMGYGMARAESDIFDQITNDLTLERGDFDGMVVGGAVGIRVAPRVELALELSYRNSNTRSEFRDWVDLDELPIEQNTKLSTIPVTASLKYFILPRGRRISSLAWVPGRWSPFIGAGGGWVNYRFKQVGDWVDFYDLSIYSDRYESEGNTGIFHVLAGTEYSLTPAFYITGEGRYSWADAGMSRDFDGFDSIDLSGFQATLGLAVRF